MTTLHSIDNLRMKMPCLGGLKLYYLLHDELRLLHIGRDKFFKILRANNRLIVPKRSY